MASKDIFFKRVQPLNEKSIQKGKYVLYWMQQSQRAEENHALAYSVEIANSRNLPVLVVFGLMDSYPEANARHYAFMLQGLKDTMKKLEEMGIGMIILRRHPVEAALSMGKKAAMIVTDTGYLRHQLDWRQKVAQKALCRMVRVESDVIVPVEIVSDKHEYAARTIRPKIHDHLNDFLVEFKQPVPAYDFPEKDDIKGIGLKDIKEILSKMKINRSVSISPFFKGGTSEAKHIFKKFIKNSLSGYERNSNQPQTNYVSHMSPYLHFGQISPVYLALETKKTDPQDIGGPFLEQLIIRRELSINHVYYNNRYDHFDCLPEWARSTLENHRRDKRKYVYGPAVLESAQTHDPYWNAAMKEMKYTGYMHNYMRMYWGKKILHWSQNPEKAFDTILYLNNKYFIDGRDSNAYTSTAWIFGLHDRPFKEREIFGKVRYMAASGLERKCDIKAYIEKVEAKIASYEKR